MTVIERPLLGTIVVQTFDLIASPFLLGVSKLDYSPLGQVGDAAVWRDWTATALNVTIHRGARLDQLALANEIGIATITLRDPGDALDPNGGIHPNAVGRILLRRPGFADVPLFTGTIHAADRAIHRDPRTGRTYPVLTLTMADAVREHNNTTRYGATGPDTFQQRIARLAASTSEPVELPTSSPTTKLARTVYESSLSNHFTLACNTAGAMWWVGADGVTRFQLRSLAAAPDAGNIGTTYINADTGSSLDGWANVIDQTNHLAVPDPDNPGEYVANDVTETRFTDDLSIGRWGERRATYDIAYEFDLADDSSFCMLRMRGPYTTPEPDVRSITYNAQHDIDQAAQFEIGRKLDLYYPGVFNPSRLIVGIHHTITPTRWLIDLDLIGATAT